VLRLRAVARKIRAQTVTGAALLTALALFL
jgi:hypothetical protein